MSESPKACLCNSSVILEGKSPKGAYQTIDGLRLYVTGPPTAKFAIVFIYDAYGYGVQNFAGADTLSKGLNCLVIMPDVLGDAVIPENHTTVPEAERNAIIARFMGKVGDFSGLRQDVLDGVAKWKKVWPSIERWGAFGLCFGGKVVAVTSREGTPFVVSGQAHPSFVAKEDPELISIPHICLPSKDEAVDIMEHYKITLDGKGYVETYPNNHHGFMGAKTDFKDPEQVAAFEKGYGQVTEFFRKYF
ncbi:hypothetical protein ABW19_dt0200636 [Dactylella cylindrospora]|nr:hypothetical protein ABW19_dt0200636 [Dactylella cylindrospora]